MLTQRMLVIGHVGQTPSLETRKIGSEDRQLLHVSIAVNNPADKDKNVSPLWVRATLWDALAVAVAPYIEQGGLVLAEGPLSYDKMTGGARVYVAKAGTPEAYAAASFEMTATEFRLLGGARNGENGNGEKPAAKVGADLVRGAGAAASGNGQAQTQAETEDIPF